MNKDMNKSSGQLSYRDWLAQKTKNGNFPYYNPARDKNEIPIVASGLRYQNGEGIMQKADLEVVKEAGFNVCMQNSLSTGGAAGWIGLSLANAKDTINIMFMTGGFYTKVENGVEKGGIINTIRGADNLPFFGGIKLIDEPTYSQMVEEEKEPDQNGNPQTLQGRYRNLMEQDVPCLVYINLIGAPITKWMKPKDPAGGDKDEGTATDPYTEYVETFQNTFKPSFFCYDLYPIYETARILYLGTKYEEPGDYEEGEVHTDDHFWKDLEFFSSFTRNLKDVNGNPVPFWVFCQGKSFMRFEDNPLYRPEALEQYLRFEAFCGLAYGAKGIIYWSYCMSETNDGESYLTALIDRKGKRTPAWYAAKKVNEEIQKYKDIFLAAEIAEVVKTNHFYYSFRKNDLLYPISIQSESDDMEIVVSVFKTGSKDYFMVVNSDPLSYQNISINTYSLSIIEVTPLKSTSPAGNILIKGLNERILIPGGYRLFTLP